MKHTYLFFGEKTSETNWEIREDETFHIKKVLRLLPGAEIELTNGSGLKATGILSQDFKSIELVHEYKTSNDHGKNSNFTFLQAVLKKELIEEVLPGLVEIGVDAVYFYAQNHAQKNIFSEKVFERAEKIIEAAVKQSKRAYKPELKFLDNLEICHGFLKTFEGTKILFDPDSNNEIQNCNFSKNILALCGSEGGFSAQETDTFATLDFQSCKIAQPILRARTASVVGSALILSQLSKI